MGKKYRSRELKKRERQYFASMYAVCVCLAAALLLAADRIFLLFPVGPYIRLGVFALLLVISGLLTSWIARGNMLRHFIRQFRVEK